MQVGSVIKYYGVIGIVTKIADAVRFPNNTPCSEAHVLFASGHKQTFDTDEPRLEVLCK